MTDAIVIPFVDFFYKSPDIQIYNLKGDDNTKQIMEELMKKATLHFIVSPDRVDPSDMKSPISEKGFQFFVVAGVMIKVYIEG
jgi:hypothetical protein